MPPAVAAAAAVVTVGSTVMSMKAQKKQAKLMRRAQKFERQKSELQSARQRTQAIREARSTLAGAQQSAENQGVATSSVAQGGQSSIQSQLNSNLSFLDTFNRLSDQAGKSLDRAAKAGANAGMWAGVAEIGAQVYAQSGGISFKGPQPPAAPKG